MSDGMGRELAYLSSHATNRYFIPNWGTKYTTGDLFGVSSSADFTFSNAEFMDSGTGKNF